jgi:hypothetical protein
MLIDSPHRKYFQKSGVFLYPALDIKRGVSITPIETYLAWEEYGITRTDKRLICVYHNREDQEHKDFEKLKLKGNKLYEATVISHDGTKIAYIFNYSSYRKDWEFLLKGKYSEFSTELKKKVKDFYRKSGNNYVYIESFLHPEKYYALYAEMLSVKIELLEQVGELCPKPDMKRETLQLGIKSSEYKPEKSHEYK